jgi:hypothetical protein
MPIHVLYLIESIPVIGRIALKFRMIRRAVRRIVPHCNMVGLRVSSVTITRAYLVLALRLEMERVGMRCPIPSIVQS